eukprot:364568-Chlamydomonas_euryale.AAC.9
MEVGHVELLEVVDEHEVGRCDAQRRERRDRRGAVAHKNLHAVGDARLLLSRGRCGGRGPGVSVIAVGVVGMALASMWSMGGASRTNGFRASGAGLQALSVAAEKHGSKNAARRRRSRARSAALKHPGLPRPHGAMSVWRRHENEGADFSPSLRLAVPMDDRACAAHQLPPAGARLGSDAAG